jgi:hypothetical protein
LSGPALAERKRGREAGRGWEKAGLGQKGKKRGRRGFGVLFVSKPFKLSFKPFSIIKTFQTLFKFSNYFKDF